MRGWRTIPTRGPVQSRRNEKETETDGETRLPAATIIISRVGCWWFTRPVPAHLGTAWTAIFGNVLEDSGLTYKWLAARRDLNGSSDFRALPRAVYYLYTPRVLTAAYSIGFTSTIFDFGRALSRLTGLRKTFDFAFDV